MSSTRYRDNDSHESTQWEEEGRGVSLDSLGDDSINTYHDDDSDDAQLALLLSSESRSSLASRTWKVLLPTSSKWRNLKRRVVRRARRTGKGQNSLAVWLNRARVFLLLCIATIVGSIVVTGLFFPSYTRLPQHYQALRNRVEQGWKSGSANVRNEKVFIAASIFDPEGKLATGDWASNVLKLVNILGPENIWLSIYENESGDKGMQALAEMETKVTCNHTLVSEEHLDERPLPNVTLPDGTQRVRRIAYLAEVRNHALRPLETANTRFDKLLYLNDVMFDPIEAASLLFLTHSDDNGVAQYRSACAVDFINPFKFYDTFATRDLGGYGMGLPFFPWFPAGTVDATLDDVLGEEDAVRVKSCWGGMVAFDASFFQNWNGQAQHPHTAGQESPLNITAPYRFRSESELWWESSECCLIHADIQSTDHRAPGVYMNPYVRTAYDSKTLSWLWLSKRFEKLYTPVHFILNILVGLPHYNPRRDEVPWQKVHNLVWQEDSSSPDGGAWHNNSRVATHDAFCGMTAMQVMKLDRQPGEKYWEFITPPPMEY